MAPQYEEHYLERPVIIEETEESDSGSEFEFEAGDRRFWSSEDDSVHIEYNSNTFFANFRPVVYEGPSANWAFMDNNRANMGEMNNGQIDLTEELGVVPEDNEQEQLNHTLNPDNWDTCSSSSADDADDEVMIDDVSEVSDVSGLGTSGDEVESDRAGWKMKRELDSEATESSTDEEPEVPLNNGNLIRTLNEPKPVADANDFDSEEDSIPFLFNFNPRPTEEEKAQNLSQEELAERRERRFWLALQNFFSDHEEQVKTKKAKMAEPEPVPESEDIAELGAVPQ